jgi:IS605 OrfB family transposase
MDKNKTTTDNGKILHHYQVNVTYQTPVSPIKTTDYHGVIGIDTNVDGFAMAEIDRCGNLINRHWVEYDLKGKNSQQREEIISESCSQIIDYALKTGKPIVMEKLDFTKKKNIMVAGKGMNKMLSNFSYAQTQSRLLRQAKLGGVQVFEVFAGYSSQTGHFCWQRQLGCSVHEAAAFVIARRYFNFKEKVRLTKHKSLKVMAKQGTIEVPAQAMQVIFNKSALKADKPVLDKNQELVLKQLRQWLVKHSTKTCQPPGVNHPQKGKKQEFEAVVEVMLSADLGQCPRFSKLG